MWLLFLVINHYRRYKFESVWSEETNFIKKLKIKQKSYLKNLHPEKFFKFMSIK